MTSAISRPYSLALDLVRAGAALTVVICHAGQLGLFAGTWPLSVVVQHVAVIIFFVLSGLVIAETTKARETSLAEFATARISRIVPVALFGIVLGNLVWFIGQYWKLDLHQPPGFDQADVVSVLFPMAFMSAAAFGSGPVTNPPYWSLCYEVWYYVIFGAANFQEQPRRTIYSLALALVAGPSILILMPVWLTGVWLQSRLPNLQISRARGAAYVLSGSAAVYVIAKNTFELRILSESLTSLGYPFLRDAQFWLADWLMTPAIATIFLGIVPWSNAAEVWLERIAGAIKWAAGSSFTLYITHWPVVSLMVAAGIKTHNALSFAAYIALVVSVSVALAALLERRATRALRQALTTAFVKRGDLVGSSP